MRRPLIAVLVATLSVVVAGPASAALSIDPGAVRMLVPPAGSGDDPVPAMAAQVGGTYRFEVGYSVAGAPRIGTGHRFVFENAVTGERMQALSKRFAPEPPGLYRESSTLTVPATWAPGIYRIRWTVSARATGLATARATGGRVFLVVG